MVCAPNVRGKLRAGIVLRKRVLIFSANSLKNYQLIHLDMIYRVTPALVDRCPVVLRSRRETQHIDAQKDILLPDSGQRQVKERNDVRRLPLQNKWRTMKNKDRFSVKRSRPWRINHHGSLMLKIVLDAGEEPFY